MTKERPPSKLRIGKRRRTWRSFVMKDKEKRQARQVSQRLKEELGRFIGPLVKALDEKLDKRLVRTFVKTLEAIIEFRHSSAGLLLSELGAYITNGGQAPAGTKRLSNL